MRLGAKLLADLMRRSDVFQAGAAPRDVAGDESLSELGARELSFAARVGRLACEAVRAESARSTVEIGRVVLTLWGVSHSAHEDQHG